MPAVRVHQRWPTSASSLRPLGQLAVRGREEPIALFEPWPDDAPPAWREAYLRAFATLDHDAAHGASLLQKLMAERPGDVAMRQLIERFPSTLEANLSSASSAPRT
jgi:adenylate cyclase